jgi:hypothetical protein
MEKLYYTTVNPLLLNVLKTAMAAKELEKFRLVGGTALSLYRGHRKSVDIDLFTDASYGSINFEAIDVFLRATYPYIDSGNYGIIGMGKSYYVGNNENECIKLDLFYTDEFIQKTEVINSIRLASVEEIIAMKIDVILRGGRKKDFWDIHELKNDYTMQQMLALHKRRHPYTHDSEMIRNNFMNFKSADEDFDPICLRAKHWEIIKLDMIDFANKI